MYYRKFIYTILIVLSIAALAFWNTHSSRSLFKYKGPYFEVRGDIVRSTYLGKKELFGPDRIEIQLEGGESYIVVSQEQLPAFDIGDKIILQLPKERTFVQDGKQSTNMFRVERVNKIQFD